MRNFLKTKFNRVRKIFNNPSKKAFGRIGLFLICGVIVFNINISISNKNLKVYNIVSAQESKSFITSVLEVLNKMGVVPDKDSAVWDGSAAIGEVLSTDPLSLALKALLWGLVAVLGVLLTAVGLLFDLTIDQEFFRTLIDNDGLYQGWVIVRDMLNMFFMLILLFSAFATIFQVEKYHLRKMIIMLIVMALLVNFSFPISRVIIDFSNSAMYFLTDNIGGSAIIAEFTDLGGSLKASSSSGSSISALILTCIFLFISICTIFAIAINLLIRILAFALLIVVSPAGFVFAFFPGTKNIADDWWGYLLKYAFMGPVMAFFLYLAVLMFDINSSVDYGKLESSLPAHFATFIVPTVFLWIGLVASQKFGGAASGAAMNFAKKTGNNIKSYGQKAAWSGVVATGIPGAVKSRYADIKGGFDKSRENREAKIASLMGSKDASENLERKRYEEDAKKMKNFNNNDLEAKAKTGNIAAADELLNRKALKDDVFREAIDKSKDDKRNADLTAKYKGANKDSRIDVVASIDARKSAGDEVKINNAMTTHGLTRDKAIEKILEDETTNRITKMNQKDFISQDFEQIYKSIDAKLASTNRLDNVEGYAIRDAIHESFKGLEANGARGDIIKNLSKNQHAELDKDGVV
ncbi:MAG: hypothetical protein ACD_7C00491G0002 [uncultured bacterium]|nr:MAG: hypothetical protein ACD_7C00491G0002 [uncultured bacterium]